MFLKILLRYLLVMHCLCSSWSWIYPIVSFKKIGHRSLRMKDVTVINLDNQETIAIPAGSPLSLAAVRSGMRLSFQCKQGSCSSCETMLDGKRVRTCITKVPEKNKITIAKAPSKR
eukprot:gene1368-2641_t